MYYWFLICVRPDFNGLTKFLWFRVDSEQTELENKKILETSFKILQLTISSLGLKGINHEACN